MAPRYAFYKLQEWRKAEPKPVNASPTSQPPPIALQEVFGRSTSLKECNGSLRRLTRLRDRLRHTPGTRPPPPRKVIQRRACVANLRQTHPGPLFRQIPPTSAHTVPVHYPIKLSVSRPRSTMRSTTPAPLCLCCEHGL